MNFEKDIYVLCIIMRRYVIQFLFCEKYERYNIEEEKLLWFIVLDILDMMIDFVFFGYVVKSNMRILWRKVGQSRMVFDGQEEERG